MNHPCLFAQLMLHNHFEMTLFLFQMRVIQNNKKGNLQPKEMERNAIADGLCFRDSNIVGQEKVVVGVC